MPARNARRDGQMCSVLGSSGPLTEQFGGHYCPAIASVIDLKSPQRAARSAAKCAWAALQMSPDQVKTQLPGGSSPSG
jgi:hypothetical protein